MRYWNIFLLNLQTVLAERGRSFVWFLLSCVNPLIMMLFWKGANVSVNTLSLITSYYFFLIIGGSVIMSHSEENIALIDIREGRLVNYLLKPFTYFILKWLEELPYRMVQGSFGVLVVLVFTYILHIHLNTILLNIVNVLLVLFITITAISLVQTYKVCLGFISFWTTDAYGIFEISDMILFILGGYIAPLVLYPGTIVTISYFLPFPYMLYFPIAAFAGFYTTQQLIMILLGEIFWLIMLSITYRFLWRSGVKIFTGVGQ